MEITRCYQPIEWEERWRRDKERRKRVMAEGGEEVERDNRELRRIVAYNDSKLGLLSRRDNKQVAGERTGDHSRKDTLEEEGFTSEVHIYHSETWSQETLKSLRNLRDSCLLTDLTLVTEDGSRQHVHSPVLAAVSSLILEKLRQRTNGQLLGAENVGVQRWFMTLASGVNCLGLEAVVQFAYTGDIPSLNQDNVSHIRKSAEILGAPRVLHLCETEDKATDEEITKGKSRVSLMEEMKITLQSIRQLWADRVGCDVILDLEGTFFEVHRVILAASSDYFRGMFTCGMRESQQCRIGLPFLSTPELEALIGHSYSGMLPLSWDSVFEITCTALQLQFQPALSLCLNFMQQEMEAKWCLDVASFAEAYGMSQLLVEANDFVLRNFWEVSSTVKFQDLPAETILDFLRSDGLCAPSELAVFRAVISWIEADPEERLSQAGLLMTAVRFSLMTFREFREVRAINLRMECFGNNEVELYGSAFKDFGSSVKQTQDHWRIRKPREALVLVGGDHLDTDTGQRSPSKEMWFVSALRSGVGLVKEMEWRHLGDMPDKPKFRHGVAVVDGKVYVLGGCYFYTKDDVMKSVYSYNPVRDGWERLADMQEFRSNFSVVVQSGRLYAMGGDKEINTNVDSVEMYDPQADTWSFVHPLEQSLSGFAAATGDGEIFISGGFDCSYVCLSSMFSYHPEGGATHLAYMAHDRAQHCMEALRGRLYVSGGVCNLRTFYTDQLACEMYDPRTDTWTEIVSLPVPHVGAASAVLEEKIYILGGYSQEDYSESGVVHRFDPRMQRWESVGKLPAAVTDIRACLLQLPENFRH